MRFVLKQGFIDYTTDVYMTLVQLLSAAAGEMAGWVLCITLSCLSGLCAGVRYPQHLLPEVIQMLVAAQQVPAALGGAQPALTPADGQLPTQQLAAAALGLSTGVRVQPPSPVSKQALSKALR